MTLGIPELWLGLRGKVGGGGKEGGGGQEQDGCRDARRGKAEGQPEGESEIN